MTKAKPKPTYAHVIGRRYAIIPYESEEFIGEIDHQTHEVFINNKAGDEEATDCLIHELLHCAEAHLKVRLPERACKMLETMVVSMMRDNGVDLSPLTRKVKLARRRHK